MARPQRNFYFGMDLGNGNIKFATEDFSERIPSFQVEHKDINSLGSVVDGNETYLIGRGAINSSFKNRTVDNRKTKIDGIERLYFGALAHLPSVPKEMTNRVIVSSHAFKTHKDIIKTNLEKTKEVTLSGQTTTVTTEVLAVVPEGYGAVFTRKDKVAVLDFGTGTALLSCYDKGKPIEFIPSKEGVQQLFNMIASEMPSINNGYPGDVDEIRRSLELGELKIDGCNIKPIYRNCLSQWWNENIKDLGKEAEKLLKEGYEVICVGGGVALPMFANILSKKGFNPVTEKPEMVNALGLYDLAIHTAKKKGLYVNAA